MAKSRHVINNKSASILNGTTFEEIKNIRNAIFQNNIVLLEAALIKVQDINHLYGFYDSNLHLIDWTSGISSMEDSTKMTLLHFAAKLGRADCIQLLINHKSNPNIYSLRNTSMLAPLLTPLHELCCGLVDEKSNYAKAAEVLLKNGADLNASVYNNTLRKTAYELCFDIETPEEKKIEESESLRRSSYRLMVPVTLPDFLRTKSADLIKEVFTNYKNIQNKDTEFKLNV